ncbi:MAG: hypothetical protein PHC28_13280 [Flavobacterium sp.]|uniref:hypothetical protein n=1 Tax=Flavobacterium sp. TaxID=239 RepID=UPI0026150F71|nr:hypothetical protein [Flavobacterium sp.]MDD5151424.1 hypothetical protein [Flavobacterium sp.]
MATVRKASGNSVKSGFLDIIERYWVVMLGLVFGVPVLFRYLRDSQTKDTVNNAEEAVKTQQGLTTVLNKDYTTQLTGLSKITTLLYIQTVARNVSVILMTDKPDTWTNSINPLYWFPDSNDLYRNLSQIKSQNALNLTAKCYQFLTNRNLLNDVKSRMSKDLLLKLPLFK